jgi:hypothetical protein
LIPSYLVRYNIHVSDAPHYQKRLEVHQYDPYQLRVPHVLPLAQMMPQLCLQFCSEAAVFFSGMMGREAISQGMQR